MRINKIGLVLILLLVAAIIFLLVDRCTLPARREPPESGSRPAIHVPARRPAAPPAPPAAVHTGPALFF